MKSQNLYKAKPHAHNIVLMNKFVSIKFIKNQIFLDVISFSYDYWLKQLQELIILKGDNFY